MQSRYDRSLDVVRSVFEECSLWLRSPLSLDENIRSDGNTVVRCNNYLSENRLVEFLCPILALPGSMARPWLTYLGAKVGRTSVSNILIK